MSSRLYKKTHAIDELILSFKSSALSKRHSDIIGSRGIAERLSLFCERVSCETLHRNMKSICNFGAAASGRETPTLYVTRRPIWPNKSCLKPGGVSSCCIPIYI